MKKEYVVTIYETFRHDLCVTAKDEDKAIKKAYKYLSNGNKEGVDTEPVGFAGYHKVEEC